MHSATTATGRPLPPPGKSLPNNRPAPLSCRAARQLAAPKPHVTSELQCYIPAPALTPLPGARFAKGHSFTQSAFCVGSRITRHCLIAQRLENAISRRKQTSAHSNRHFLQVSASHQRRIAAMDRPPQTAADTVSNRQWQILEINVNLSKQTIAPRSNRHKNAILKCQKSHVTTARHGPTTERLPREQGIGGPSELVLVIPKAAHSFAAICGGAESDILVWQSGPRLRMGNLWRITEWFN